MFIVPNAWLRGKIRVILVGAGGSGSEMLDGLARIDSALRAFEHPGMRVEVYDPDTVSHSNTVRQRFWPCDIGHYKAELLMHRYGTFGGLDGRAHTVKFTEQTLRNLDPFEIQLLVTCVDKAAVRDWIGRIAATEMDLSLDTALWLDMGNGARSGQVVLGHLSGWHDDPERLPNVCNLFPELADHERFDKDDAPSCSAEEAIAQQDLFINRWMAISACDMLWQLLHRGMLPYHGMLVSEAGARVREIGADPMTWASFGLSIEEQRGSGLAA